MILTIFDNILMSVLTSTIIVVITASKINSIYGISCLFLSMTLKRQ